MQAAGYLQPLPILQNSALCIFGLTAFCQRENSPMQVLPHNTKYAFIPIPITAFSRQLLALLAAPSPLLKHFTATIRISSPARQPRDRLSILYHQMSKCSNQAKQFISFHHILYLIATLAANMIFGRDSMIFAVVPLQA